MKNRFSFFRLGCLAILYASSPILLSGDDLNSRIAFESANKSSEEYRKLFSMLLNPHEVDFEEFGSDSKAISVISMFSDEKLSGAELQIMHWIDFKAPEGSKSVKPTEVDAVNQRAQSKKEYLQSQVEEERDQVESRVANQRSRLDKKLRLETEMELSALKEKSKKLNEEKLIKEQQDDLARMLEIEKKIHMQEDEERSTADLEAKLQKQEIERKKLDLLERSSKEKIDEIKNMNLKAEKRISDIASLEIIAEELEEEANSSEQREPLFQGSLWRISPTDSGKSEKQTQSMFSDVTIPGEENDFLPESFSLEEKSVILESLDRFERTRSLNKGPQLKQALTTSSHTVYPCWASGSRLLERALDKCRNSDEYLVLSFSVHGVPVPRDIIIKDLQKYGISPAKTKQAVTFVECDMNSHNLDQKVEDLLIMSGIWDNQGYIVIELAGNLEAPTAKIVKSCPLNLNRAVKSKIFVCKRNDKNNS